MEVSNNKVGTGGGGGVGTTAEEPTTADDARQEIRLLFFGTFFHENTGLTADLIQLKENARIAEIRVIPLGATVDLSTGAYQLGATNPSEFDLEFYYNDLQVPAKTTFELLRNFKFNDKLRIQLICSDDECIITDGLLVRGIYSTVTLAVYGYTVDKVPIKEEEKIETPIIVKESVLSDPVPAASPLTPIKDSSPKVKPLIEPNMRDTSVEKEIGVETDTELGEELSKGSKTTDDIVPDGSPKAIPTITTRVNYDALPGSGEVSEMEDVQGSTEVEESPRSMDQTVESVAPQESPVAPAQVPIIPAIVDDMDVEEISDGEVFPSDDEEDLGIKSQSGPSKSDPNVVSPAASGVAGSEPMDFENTSKKADSLIEEVEPITSPVEPVSEGDGSLVDEFQEPGIEEIISDEDLPDFPDYDEAEWEDHWTHRYKNFNPYSESYGVSRLHNITINHTSKELSNLSIKECWNTLVVATEKYSGSTVEGDLLESLIEDIENLVPIIPRAVLHFNRSPINESLRVQKAILKWVDMGTEISLALNQNSLPFIVRHLKAGISLVQCIANLDCELSDEVMKLRFPSNENPDSSRVSIQHRLMQLMNEPNTKNSRLRVLVLRAIDATVSTRKGLNMFLQSENPNYDQSLNKQLIDLAISSDPEFSTRMSYSLRSLEKKIRLMQGLNAIESYVKDSVTSSANVLEGFPSEIISEWTVFLQDLKETASYVDQFFSFPMRIIPAESVLELPPLGSPGHDPKYSFVRMLQQYNFVQVAAVILNSRNISLELVSQIVEIIEIISQWEAGLVFLCNSEKATTLLIRSLLQFDDDINYLGLLLAHSIEVMACIDGLSNDEPTSFEEEMKINEMLHTLMNFKNTHPGREALVNVLTKGNLIQPILKCIQQWEEKLLVHSKTQQKDIHAHTGYAIEILEFIIRKCGSVDFLQKHGIAIYTLISSLDEKHDCFKKLTEVQVYLNPTLSDNFSGLHNLNKCIENLCDRVKSCVDTSSQPKIVHNSHWGISGEVITCLRILAQLADPPNLNELVINPSELRIRELKYDLALAKIHELDLKTTIISILQKILDDVVHAPLLSFTLVTQKGDFLLSLLQPSLKLLQRMISQVVKTRKTEYRDITPVPALVGVYGLIYYFPSRSPSSTNMQKLTQTILETLLSYTIPAVKQGAETEEELNKSIWTGTISSIIKYTLERPVNFLPGVALLSEMLPLPFPVASNSKLSDDACCENIKLRRLWSAYMHGLTSQLQDLVYTLCNSSDCKLQNLLKRVCVQLGDLSPSTCLLICRAILDMLLFLIEKDKAENSISDDSTTVQGFQCTLVTSRLLGFLASLINNFAPIKCGILQILRSTSRVDEKYSDLITLLCCILSTPGSNLSMNNRHVQAQDNLLTIFQSFCDVEINMLIPIVGQSDKKFDWSYILANSLPQRDHIIMICSALLKNLSLLNANITDAVQILEGVLRSMEIIAETDYGFYYLKTALDKTSGVLNKVCQILATFEIDSLESFEGIVPTIISFLDLLKTMTTSRPQQMGSYPPRLSILKSDDLMRYLQWTSDSTKELTGSKVVCDAAPLEVKSEESKAADESTSITDQMDTSGSERTDTKIRVHPLMQLKLLFEDQLRLIRESGYVLSNIEVTEVENGLSCIVNLIQYLNETKPNEAETSLSEVVLPNPESLSELYTVRPVYVIVERPNHETLPLFWMTGVPPAFELDPDTSEADMIPCNFNDLASNFPNFDLSKEIEGLFRKSEVNSKEKDTSKVGHGEGANKERIGSTLMSSPHMMHYQNRRGHQFGQSMRGSTGRGGFSRNLLAGSGRMGNMMYDPFRSRPPNTSRPPSLHVDDFVALESSGTSGGPMRTSSSDAYAPRGRGSSRGSGLLSRPYSHDRGGRNARSAPGQGGFYLTSRNEPPISAAKGSRASRGGRIYSTPTSDRWTADNRGGGHSYDRTSRPSNAYDDKYRSGSVGPNRNTSTPGSPRSHLPSYTQRSSSSGYRDARSSPSSSNPRFRDRQKPFNR